VYRCPQRVVFGQHGQYLPLQCRRQDRLRRRGVRIADLEQVARVSPVSILVVNPVISRLLLTFLHTSRS